MPTIDVIIINYKAKELTINCLIALEKQHYKDFSLILVDNGSHDGSRERIDEFMKGATFNKPVITLYLNTNTGFTGGNIEGLKHSEAEYIALLNNDTEPEGEWLAELIKSMDNNPEVGICATKILVHNTNIIDSAADGFSTILKGFKRGEGESDSKYNKAEYVFGACAGAALYRRKMIEDIGFFDNDFFLIHEDTDLNLRAQLSGWKVVYVPTALVHHKVRSSIGKLGDTAIYFSLRNSELVRIKNLPLALLIIYFPWLILCTLLDIIYFAILHRKPGLYIKAKTDALKLLPHMFKKRKEILNRRKVGISYIMRIMTPVWERNMFKSKWKKFISYN